MSRNTDGKREVGIGNAAIFAALLLILLLPFAAFAQGKLRLVTLAPNLTETIFALGHGDEVVGVTDFCKFPEEAKSRRHVGGLFDANAEVIMSLKPDLVFLTPAHRKMLEAMSGAGIKTVQTETETIEDVYTTTAKVGAALDDTPAGDKLIAKMKSDIASVKEKSGASKKVKVLFVVGYSSEGMREIYGVGPHTFLDELMVLAGGENLLIDSSVRYPIVTREFLIANAPDVIIDANGGGDAKSARSDDDKKTAREKWYSLFGAAASKQPRIEFIDDAHITIPGPAIAESAEKIRKLIAPPTTP
ncbi:MAG: helical backbone metal receptor [Candidatus Sumerlaeota bacterium]